MHTFSRGLQVCGLTILPYALFLGFTSEHGMWAELGLFLVGSTIFFAGRLLQRRFS